MQARSSRHRVGLIGWPVAHSVSPAMHNAVFDALGMDWHYDLLPTPPHAIEQRIDEIRSQELVGANVTIPHKQAVLPFLDEIVEAATVVRAVNTIVSAGNTLVGYNTDVAGVAWALRKHGVVPAGWHVVVLGAGGAARGALYALDKLGVASISVFNRTPERAEHLIEELGPHLGVSELTAWPLSDRSRLEDALARAGLLVNTTSVGMHPHDDVSPLPDGIAWPAGFVVFDMVYNPQQTRLLKQVAQERAQTIGGLDMLVGQGVESFKLWTGRTPDADLMQQAALAVLEAQG